jgi:hypothetical protein
MYSPSIPPSSNRTTVTVRQTTDPYVIDIQYIASREVTLEPNGTLCMSTIGLGKPGDNFIVCHSFNFRPSQLNSRNYSLYRVRNGQIIHFHWLPCIRQSPTFCALLVLK